jgi:fumarate hydratase class II
MLAAQVLGNDVAINIGGMSVNFELSNRAMPRGLTVLARIRPSNALAASRITP